MSKDIQQVTPFTHSELGEVRTIEIGQDPWFVLSDVCHILSIKNVGDASTSLDDDEKQQVNSNIVNADVAQGGRSPWIINVCRRGVRLLRVLSRGK